ncbi:glutamate racemase [Pseudoalteromonas sp. MMG010]|uniref:glutamate racemase n=1 Tax=Pseudoalteromonas sp. MMG010 TaxID=2822685 RepID=UPI001B39E4A0|nr:glutamate racemase [Pseudoalteromonas sp. MMG010]MBQ4834127.1 glutamate racemase [Pseudoalteromonas sp. MMG010]
MPAHILVFDSGIGGTTVLGHIQRSIPYAQYSYFMDNELLPYGAQTQQTIINRLSALIRYIEHKKLNVDLIVIACNTASTSALSAVRLITNIPIVGVVPAIKPAAQLTQSNKIGLLATPATIASEYTKELIRTHASCAHVSLLSSVELVTIAENFFFTDELKIEKLHKELVRLNISPEIDVLVLGCTHFPILADAINEFLNKQVKLLDSGQAIANRVYDLLLNTDKLTVTASATKKPLHFYATAYTSDNVLSTQDIITQIDLTQYVQS